MKNGEHEERLFLALIHTITKVKSVNVDKGLLEREIVDETLLSIIIKKCPDSNYHIIIK